MLGYIQFRPIKSSLYGQVFCAAQMQLCGSLVPSPHLENIKGLKIGRIADRTGNHRAG